jgi:hypothetical protein
MDYTEIDKLKGTPVDPNATPATPPEVPWESPGQLARVVGRLFGTDVDDPLPWTRMGTTLAGSIGGSILGGAYTPGGPMAKAAGVIAGGLAGTVVGAAAPETVLEGLEQAGILRPGERERIGLSNEQLMTVVEGEGLLDLYTLGGVSLLRGGGRGIVSLLTGANRGTRATAEAATREGIAMLPVQVGEGRFARGYVSVMGHFPWIAAGLKKKANASLDQISRAFDGIPARLGPLSTFNEVGGRILRDANQTAAAISTDFTQRFNGLMARADMAGVRVRPVNTRAATEAVMKQLESATPRADAKVWGAEVPLSVTKNMADLRKFLNSNVRRIYNGTQIADFSVRQMDTIIQTLDEKMVQYAKTGDTVTMGRLERIRNGIAADMTTNAVSKGNRPLSVADQEIVRQYRQVDQEMTEAVNFLFNSTTAQRMGSRISPTIRSANFADQGMRGADALGKVLLRGESPEAVAEIARLVQPETMQRLANAYFTEALEKSTAPAAEGLGRRLDAEAFSREIGLNAPNSGKFAQTEALMREAGGLSMDELRELVEIARLAGETPIPDVSTFIARGAAFKGIKATVKSALPLTAVVSATGAGFGLGASLVSGIATIGGLRLLSSAISNPASARALRRVMDVEASTAVKRAAYVRATGFAVGGLVEAGKLTVEEGDNLLNNLRQYGVEVDKRLKNEQYK